MTATINPLNTIKGPANIWVAAFGTTEPAQTQPALIADPGAGWTFVGATQGGISWEDDQTVTDTAADQVIDDIGGRVTKRKIIVTLNLLEPTLANLAIALNRFGTTNVGTGITTYTPGQYNAGSIPAYSAILVDGQAPQIAGGGQARRRLIVRKTLNQNGKVSLDSDPQKDQMIAASFKSYFVSPSLDPYIVMDQTA